MVSLGGDVHIGSPIEMILEEICQKHQVTQADVVGPSRAGLHTRARHELFYRAATERPDISLTVIGRLIGGRDHTTVLSGAHCHADRHNLSDPTRTVKANSVQRIIREAKQAARVVEGAA